MAEDKENDVDLEELFKEESDDKSEEVDTSGASDQKQKSEGSDKSKPKEGEGDDDKDLSPRAKERIDELNNRIKSLEEGNKKKEEAPADEKKDDLPFQDVDSFIAAIKDEPSRKLLDNFAKLLNKDISSRVSPVVDQYTSSRFDAEFDQYAKKAPALAAYKDDLKKTFMRNPNKSVKSLVGEVIMDVMVSKVKPIEKKAATPNRGGAPSSLDDASKDDLYSMLESSKP